MTLLDKLEKLYMKQSKHSNYQVLPRSLRNYLYNNSIETKSRYEFERLSFINQKLDFKNKKILDIGANTGFFSFESLEIGAAHVLSYEGNATHADFINVAAKFLNFEDRLTVIKSYFNVQEFCLEKPIDITFLMNVLHHVGDDFGDTSIDVEKARYLIAEFLLNMSYLTHYLVFQIGFCWKGNRKTPLFFEGTKQEQIDFVTCAIKDKWELLALGIPESRDNGISYFAPTVENLKRNNKLGEFLNRPLFVLKSKIA